MFATNNLYNPFLCSLELISLIPGSIQTSNMFFNSNNHKLPVKKKIKLEIAFKNKDSDVLSKFRFWWTISNLNWASLYLIFLHQSNESVQFLCISPAIRIIAQDLSFSIFSRQFYERKKMRDTNFGTKSYPP